MIAKSTGSDAIYDALALCELSDHQLEAAWTIVSNRLSILGGGPGTGKTYTIASLVCVLRTLVGADHICIGTPTGKASVRVKQALGAIGIDDVRIGTWHSILRVCGGMNDFKHDASNPLPFRWVIGDESSMIPCDLMASIIGASQYAHTIFVGDVHQLAPVGHGAPLRDLIAAGIPYAELTEVRRNSGRIVQACHAIRKQETWNPSGSIDLTTGENLELLHCVKPDQQIKSVVAEMHAAKRRGLDPVWDCQVVVPLNSKGEVSRREFNRVLQGELNHNDPVDGTKFRLGDKVINTAPCILPTVDKDSFHVANGEQGEIVAIEEKTIVVSLRDSRKTVIAFRGQPKKDDQDAKDDDESVGNSGCTFDLGYAVSCHKAQGSEWPYVAVVLDAFPGAKRICDRSWLYTAISRAKQHCALVGTMATARDMCRRNKIQERKTFLADLVKATFKEQKT